MNSLRRSSREEFDKVVDDAVGRFFLQVVAGWKRLRVNEVAREFAPHSGKFLGRRLPSRSPQYQERHHDLAVLVSAVHLEINGGAGAIVAAGATDRLMGEAADVFIEHDLGRIPAAGAAFEEPLGRNGAYHRYRQWLRLRQEHPMPGV